MPPMIIAYARRPASRSPTSNGLKPILHLLLLIFFPENDCDSNDQPHQSRSRSNISAPVNKCKHSGSNQSDYKRDQGSRSRTYGKKYQCENHSCSKNISPGSKIRSMKLNREHTVQDLSSIDADLRHSCCILICYWN